MVQATPPTTPPTVAPFIISLAVLKNPSTCASFKSPSSLNVAIGLQTTSFSGFKFKHSESLLQALSNNAVEVLSFKSLVYTAIFLKSA